jgi:hypothetical protein
MRPGGTVVIYKPDRVALSVKELLVLPEEQLAPSGVSADPDRLQRHRRQRWDPTVP